MKKTLAMMVITALISGGAGFVGGKEYQKYEFKQKLIKTFNIKENDSDKKLESNKKTEAVKEVVEVKEVSPAWVINPVKDEMTNKTKFIIAQNSSNDKGTSSSAYLNYAVFVANKEERISLTLSDFIVQVQGQNIIDDIVSIRVRWDNELVNTKFYHEYGKDTFFPINLKDFESRMSNHKKMLIEINIENGRNKYFEYDISEFNKAKDDISLKLNKANK